jgi:aldehyde dehydrogenase
MVVAAPVQSGSQSIFQTRYDNFIGGKWVPPVKGKYSENLSPITGKSICQVPRSSAEDVELALSSAHAAKDKWGKTNPADRARVLHKIADRIEENLDRLAIAETWDNGKPIRETRLADIPLAIDHFRYFASCIRAQEGSIGELDGTTVAYHFHEPLGRVFLPRCILENSELRQGVLMNPWRLK